MHKCASTAIYRVATTASLAPAAAAATIIPFTYTSANNTVAIHPQRKCFSTSHDDFAPKKYVLKDDNEDEVKNMIQQQVNDNPVMLYMKGNPKMPMCGFSAKMVQTLQSEGIDFSSVNVLDYPSIREGVKKFASWPTM